MSRMIGTVSRGVRAPIIKEGDDIVEIVNDFFVTMNEEDIDNLINHYLHNRIEGGDTEHVKQLITSMLLTSTHMMRKAFLKPLLQISFSIR